MLNPTPTATTASPPPQGHAPLPKSTTLVRLHITPFSPALYSTLVPAPLQALAARAGHGPSFHTVETFPERGFGYIDLPAADAQRLKQKLHGSTLRGMKLRVEAARPEKRKQQPSASPPPTTEEPPRPAKSPHTAKGDGVLRGVAMPAGRVVKRGWAEVPGAAAEDKKKHRKPASAEEREREKKKPRKAKKVDTGQMLFRTALPANVAARADEGDDVAKKAKKSKQGRKVPTEVKEFERTSKFPTFLRDKQPGAGEGKTATATEFVEGKGWVDADGNVVEELKIAKRPKHTVEAVAGPAKKRKQPVEQDDSESEESSVVSSDSDSDLESSSDASSSAAESNDADDSATETAERDQTSPKTPTPVKEVHPLEALFKRPASRDKKPENLAPIDTAFSFFGGIEGSDAIDDSIDESNIMKPPQTPFTQRDLEHRGQRSAAPTPDTAAIGKRFRLPSVDISAGLGSGEDDDDDDDDEDDEDASMADVGFGGEHITQGQSSQAEDADQDGDKDDKQEEQNEFEKHFWAHRGDYNRAWKQRKREARKEKRQSENRRGAGQRSNKN